MIKDINQLTPEEKALLRAHDEKPPRRKPQAAAKEAVPVQAKKAAPAPVVAEHVEHVEQDRPIQAKEADAPIPAKEEHAPARVEKDVSSAAVKHVEEEDAPVEAAAPAPARGPYTPAQWDDDGWGGLPVQMRG